MRHFIHQRGGNHFDHRLRMRRQRAPCRGRRPARPVAVCFQIAGRWDRYPANKHRRKSNRAMADSDASARSVASSSSRSTSASRSSSSLRFENAFAHQKQPEFRHRVAMGFGVALFGSFVKLFVIGKRMRIGPRDSARAPAPVPARTAIFRGALQSFVAFQRIGAVALFDMQQRNARDELRNASAGRLRFDGHGNRPAVVLHQKTEPARAAGSRRLALRKIRLRWSSLRRRKRAQFHRGA